MAVVFKNTYPVYLIGFIFGYVQLLFQIVLELEDGGLFVVGNCPNLFRLKDGGEVTIEVSSVVIGGRFLMPGYFYFKQDDLHQSFAAVKDVPFSRLGSESV